MGPEAVEVLHVLLKSCLVGYDSDRHEERRLVPGPAVDLLSEHL